MRYFGGSFSSAPGVNAFFVVKHVLFQMTLKLSWSSAKATVVYCANQLHQNLETRQKKTQSVYFNNGFFYPRYCRQLPTSLEELLEYQWEQGAQFLMQQASQYDGIMLILHSNVTRIASKIVVAHVHQENILYLVIIYFFLTICLLYDAQML